MRVRAFFVDGQTVYPLMAATTWLLRPAFAVTPENNRTETFKDPADEFRQVLDNSEMKHGATP